MANDIMGERLKGLYESCDHISGPRLLEDRLGVEYHIIDKTGLECTQMENKMIDSLSVMLPDRDKLVQDNFKISKTRLALHEEVKLSRNITKESIDKKTKELEMTKEERDHLQEENIKLEKRSKELNNELDNNRAKLKQILAKRRQFGEKEQKNCKLCGRDYYENENYNWSCKKHTTLFSSDENIYWCCGRFGKNAPECTVSKHESRDDEDEQENERQRETREKVKISHAICSSCKEIGHRPQECPRDPNARTNYQPNEELVRIHKIKKDKMRKNLVTSEVQHKMIDIIKNKISTEEAFGSDKVSSIGFTDTNRSSRGDKSRRGFHDLNDIKQGLQFSSKDNLIIIQEIYSKTLEKEAIKSTKSLKLPNASSSVSRSEKRVDTVMSSRSDLKITGFDSLDDKFSAGTSIQRTLKSPVSKQTAGSTRSRSGSEYF